MLIYAIRFFPKFFGTFENEDGFYMTLENLMWGKVRISPISRKINFY